MKKLLIIVGVLALLAIITRAEDILQVATPEGQKYYRAKEFSIDAFGGVRTSDFDSERSHVGVGLNYFLTENIGAGVYTSWEDTFGQFMDNLTVRGIYRIPIDKNAIYGYVGGQYLFDNSDWAGNLGVGVERRWTHHIGTFLEIGMHKELTGNERPASATAKIGVRYAF